MSDLISRAEAIALLTEIVFDEPPIFGSETLCRLYAEEQINTLSSAEIAETEPIAIRSKTLLPTKDFNEWAKRIREVNPNAVVIPCDAEVVSAETAHGWIPCSKRLPENTAEWKAYLTCNEAGLISTTYWADGWNCSRNLDGEINRVCELTDIVAWMPLPEPYREQNDEEV